MIERTKSHSFPVRFSILLGMLGMCVFLWGFGYKLSLYDTHKPTIHRIPEAKLLSKNEDPSATDSLRLCVASRVTAPLGLLLCAMLIFLAPHGTKEPFPASVVSTRDFVGLQLRFILSAFFFRPPPIQSFR